MDILSLSAVETAKKIKSGELSVREVLDAVFTAIDEKEKNITALFPSAARRLMPVLRGFRLR